MAGKARYDVLAVERLVRGTDLLRAVSSSSAVIVVEGDMPGT